MKNLSQSFHEINPQIPNFVGGRLENITQEYMDENYPRRITLRETHHPVGSIQIIEAFMGFSNDRTRTNECRYSLHFEKGQLISIVKRRDKKKIPFTNPYVDLIRDYITCINEVTVRRLDLKNYPIGRYKSGDIIACPDGKEREIRKNLTHKLKNDKFSTWFVFTDGTTLNSSYDWFLTTKLDFSNFKQMILMCQTCEYYQLAHDRCPLAGPWWVEKKNGFYCGICFDHLQDTEGIDWRMKR